MTFPFRPRSDLRPSPAWPTTPRASPPAALPRAMRSARPAADYRTTATRSCLP